VKMLEWNVGMKCWMAVVHFLKPFILHMKICQTNPRKIELNISQLAYM
jgi:hypothetical protein